MDSSIRRLSLGLLIVAVGMARPLSWAHAAAEGARENQGSENTEAGGEGTPGEDGSSHEGPSSSGNEGTANEGSQGAGGTEGAGGGSEGAEGASEGQAGGSEGSESGNDGGEANEGGSGNTDVSQLASEALAYAGKQLNTLAGLDQMSSPAAPVQFRSPLLYPLAQQLLGEIETWFGNIEDNTNLFTKYHFTVGSDQSQFADIEGKTGSAFDQTWVNDNIKIWQTTIQKLQNDLSKLPEDARTVIAQAIAIGQSQIERLQAVKTRL